MSNNVRNIRSAASARTKNINGVGDALAVVGIIVAAVVLIAAVVVLGGLLTMFAWNVGVGAVVAAAGGHVGNISLLAAIAFNVAWGIVGRPFRRQAQPQQTDQS